MIHKRVDQVLAEAFPHLSRSRIQSLISRSKIEFLTSKKIWVPVGKPGEKVDPSLFTLDRLRILPDEELEFVSRGGVKLNFALEHFPVPSLEGVVALDIGLSTGGFSDCLLKRGVAKILGVDVGKEQLHPSLRTDTRLVWHDKVNCRYPIPDSILSTFFQNRPWF